MFVMAPIKPSKHLCVQRWSVPVGWVKAHSSAVPGAAAVEVWGFLTEIRPRPLALGGVMLPALSCWG